LLVGVLVFSPVRVSPPAVASPYTTSSILWGRGVSFPLPFFSWDDSRDHTVFIPRFRVFLFSFYRLPQFNPSFFEFSTHSFPSNPSTIEYGFRDPEQRQFFRPPLPLTMMVYLFFALTQEKPLADSLRRFSRAPLCFFPPKSEGVGFEKPPTLEA